MAGLPGAQQAAGASHHQVSASSWRGRRRPLHHSKRLLVPALPARCLPPAEPAPQPPPIPTPSPVPIACNHCLCVCRRLEALAEPGAAAALSDDEPGSAGGGSGGSDGGEGDTRVQRSTVASQMTHGRRALRIQHELAPVGLHVQLCCAGVTGCPALPGTSLPCPAPHWRSQCCRQDGWQGAAPLH